MTERDREREKYSRGDSASHLAPISDKISMWLKPVEDPKALSEAIPEPTAAQIRGPSKYVYSSGFFSSTTTGQGQVAHVAPASLPSNVPNPSNLSYQYSDPSTYSRINSDSQVRSSLPFSAFLSSSLHDAYEASEWSSSTVIRKIGRKKSRQ